MSSVHGASGYNLSHTLQSIRRKLKGGSFFVEGTDRAVATTIAVQTTSAVRGDQLRFSEVELTKNVTLLTKEVLLMVTRGKRGVESERESEREREERGM